MDNSFGLLINDSQRCSSSSSDECPPVSKLHKRFRAICYKYFHIVFSLISSVLLILLAMNSVGDWSLFMNCDIFTQCCACVMLDPGRAGDVTRANDVTNFLCIYKCDVFIRTRQIDIYTICHPDVVLLYFYTFVTI